MMIIGCDLHTRYQQVAMLDTETGEEVERGAGPADVFRPVYDKPDAPPVAVSRVGYDADGIRRLCGWLMR